MVVYFLQLLPKHFPVAKSVLVIAVESTPPLIVIDDGDSRTGSFGNSSPLKPVSLYFPKSEEISTPKVFGLIVNVNGCSGNVFNVSKSNFATGNDDLRPVMSGVFCQLEKDSITFAATDAHKLVRYTRNDTKADKSSSFIFPKKPLNLLKGIVPEESPVVLEYNDSNAHFSFGDIKLICRLIDGKYPNYEAVIPNENPNRLTIDRSAFLNSIKRVSIFSNKTTHQVRLKITGSELSISAEDLDFSNEANERLSCSYDGEDMEIGFNSRFIIEMLSNLDTENINLEMSAPNRAGIMHPVSEEKTAEDILMLVMPVMLNS